MLLELDDLLLDVDALSALPPTATRLAALLSQEDWDLGEIAGVVTLDPVLTARVLRTANSAHAGSLREIHSVREAVLRLGAGMVTSVAVSTSLQKVLQPRPEHDPHSESSLWRHSVAALCAVERMRADCRITPPPETHTAALLHDVGRLVLSRHLSATVARLLERARSEGGLSSISAERELLDVDHAELGALVAQHWALPVGIVHGIQYHPCPEAAPEEHGRAVARAVALANRCAVRVTGIQNPAPDDGTDPTVETTLDVDEKDEKVVLDALGVSPAAFAALQIRVSERLEERLSCYRT